MSLTLTSRRHTARPAPSLTDLAAMRAAAELDRHLAATDRAATRAARAERAQAISAAARRLAVVVPLLLVNGLAITGQIGYALDHLASPTTPLPARLALAVLSAAALESVALYVGWQAHAALLAGATMTAARRRLAAYLIAAFVACINYAHYAGPAGSPNPAAVAFGLVSFLSPWLWGMHSRRELHDVLTQNGLNDPGGARFAASRWKVAPLRTFKAWRWSVLNGVQDPARAWHDYEVHRRAPKTATTPAREGAEGAASKPEQARASVTVPAASSSRRRSVVVAHDRTAGKAGGGKYAQTRAWYLGVRSSGKPTPKTAEIAEKIKEETGYSRDGGYIRRLRGGWDDDFDAGRIGTA